MLLEEVAIGMETWFERDLRPAGYIAIEIPGMSTKAANDWYEKNGMGRPYTPVLPITGRTLDEMKNPWLP